MVNLYYYQTCLLKGIPGIPKLWVFCIDLVWNHKNLEVRASMILTELPTVWLRLISNPILCNIEGYTSIRAVLVHNQQKYPNAKSKLTQILEISFYRTWLVQNRICGKIHSEINKSFLLSHRLFHWLTNNDLYYGLYGLINVTFKIYTSGWDQGLKFTLTDDLVQSHLIIIGALADWVQIE